MTPRRNTRASNKNQSRKNQKNKNKQHKSINTPLYIKPDHHIRVRHIAFFDNNNITSTYFDSFSIIKPYEILNLSSYSNLQTIYESVRTTRIHIKIWLPSVSIITPGYTSSFLYRDVVTNSPNRYAEQLIVEPGSKTGRPHKTFSFTWKPIEPSDYEFFNHSTFANMDNSRYGQINYAGASFNTTIGKPLIEYIIDYDFKSLYKPEAPPQLRLTPDDKNTTYVLISN